MSNTNLIIAWAKGAQIQCRRLDSDTPAWIDCGPPGGTNQPLWRADWAYRIKPSSTLYAGVYISRDAEAYLGAVTTLKSDIGRRDGLKSILTIELDNETGMLLQATCEPVKD